MIFQNVLQTSMQVCKFDNQMKSKYLFEEMRWGLLYLKLFKVDISSGIQHRTYVKHEFLLYHIRLGYLADSWSQFFDSRNFTQQLDYFHSDQLLARFVIDYFLLVHSFDLVLAHYLGQSIGWSLGQNLDWSLA